MIHTTDTIADGRYLDREITKQVAKQSPAQFGVITYGDVSYVGTFFVDRLVEAVKAAQGDKTEEIRLARIAELYPKD